MHFPPVLPQDLSGVANFRTAGHKRPALCTLSVRLRNLFRTNPIGYYGRVAFAMSRALAPKSGAPFVRKVSNTRLWVAASDQGRGSDVTYPDHISPEEGFFINKALFDGNPDQAFELLAAYLKRNGSGKGSDVKLSDRVLRLYLEEELFECFTRQSKSAPTETFLNGQAVSNKRSRPVPERVQVTWRQPAEPAACAWQNLASAQPAWVL